MGGQWWSALARELTLGGPRRNVRKKTVTIGPKRAMLDQHLAQVMAPIDDMAHIRGFANSGLAGGTNSGGWCGRSVVGAGNALEGGAED